LEEVQAGILYTKDELEKRCQATFKEQEAGGNFTYNHRYWPPLLVISNMYAL